MGKLNTVKNGKGSVPRPIKNLNDYSSNWDQIDWSKQKQIDKNNKIKKDVSKDLSKH